MSFGLKSKHAGARSHGPAKRRPKSDVKAEINVTPLVDVVLVLLIIFMVVTPMLSRGVAVDLPVSKYHNKKNDDGLDLIVSISKAGEIYVGADAVPLARLTAKVEEELRKSPGKPIFLKGDARIKYGQARKVMEAINKGGTENIQLGTEDKKGN